MIFSSILVMYRRTFLVLTLLQWLNVFFIQIKVIYKGVLSICQAWLDLWYKGQNSPFDNSFSNNFSLFQLETKNLFLQTILAIHTYMVSIQKIFVWKNLIYILETCHFELFWYVINCLLQIETPYAKKLK